MTSGNVTRWPASGRRGAEADDARTCGYADDIVVGFEHETDARRFWDAMRDRLQEFSLSLHPKKTRLIEFGRHAANNRKRRGLGKPETFNFLGIGQRVDVEEAHRVGECILDEHAFGVAGDEVFDGTACVVGEQDGRLVVAEVGDEELAAGALKRTSLLFVEPRVTVFAVG